MERHMRDVLEDEVVYDHSQFGLLNSQEDDTSTTAVLSESKHKPRRRKWGKLLRTAALCGAYVSLGLCFSVTGPTLLFLKEQVGATMSEISYIFTARSVGTLAGAFIGGAALDKCNPYSTFFTVLASMGISIGAMPWFKHLWALMASSVVVGIANGFLDTGASTLCLQLWGKDSGPYMQSLHFAFAVGGSIAPLLVEAFVVEIAVANQTSSSRHVRSITESLNSSDINTTTMAAIIQAVTQAPALINTVENVTTTSTTTLTPATNLTTVMVNQTTLATEKPKKPKPSITNGGVLGDSSQFESIPLKIAPVEPEPPVTTSITSQAPETTSTTQSSTTLSSSQQTLNATTLSTNYSSAIVAEPADKLNLSGSINDLGKHPDSPLLINQSNSAVSNASTLSEKNQSKTDIPSDSGNSTVNTQTSEVNSHEDAPKSTLDTVAHAPQDVDLSNSKIGEASQIEEAKSTSTAKPIEITTTTASTTSSAITSTTTVSSTSSTTTRPLAPSTTTTQAPLKTETQAPSTTQSTTGVPSTTTTTTESSATKSRGKNRGQQEEISLAIPTKAPTESAPPATAEADIGGTNHPNVVVDYLERFGVTRMHMLYTVIAIIVLHTSFAFLFFLCSSSAFTASLNADRHATDRKVRPFRPKTRLIFVSLMFLFYLLYVGAEVVYSQFLATFTLESHSSSSTSTANYVTTTYWAAFAIGRFAAIFVANFLSPTVMLYSNLGLTALGAIILCATAQTNLTLLYIGSAFIGFGMAPTFAAGFVWTELHLLVTHRISAAFSVASSMGEMFFPTVTGSLIEVYPMALMYEVLGSILLCMVIILGAGYLANYRSKRSADMAGYHLASQTEELSQN